MHNMKLARFPLPVHNRIPNFVGAREAAFNLAQTEEFRNCKVIKVNGSLAQQPVRYWVLKRQKKLIVPHPALEDAKAIFYEIDPKKHGQRMYGFLATKKGMMKFGASIGLEQKIERVDMCVVGSVAVCPHNGARLGKGKGYAEIEYAILRSLGVIDDNTLVVTTVHDSQLWYDMTANTVMQEFDLPVDLIVTPTQIIQPQNKLPKPHKGIIWSKVSERMIREIPVLTELKQKDISTK